VIGGAALVCTALGYFNTAWHFGAIAAALVYLAPSLMRSASALLVPRRGRQHQARLDQKGI
jgi:hypothetical protein